MTIDLFSIAVQQFMQASVPGPEPVYSQCAAVDVYIKRPAGGWHARLVEYWAGQFSHQRDLPLPLGSAVPAAPNVEGGLLRLTASPVHRAVLALLALQRQSQLQLLEPETGGQPRVRAVAGRHVRQIVGSRDDFLLRHPMPNELRASPVHLNRQYVLALCQLAQEALKSAGHPALEATLVGQPVEQAYIDNLVRRMNDMRLEDNVRLQADRQTAKSRYLPAFDPSDLNGGEGKDETDWLNDSDVDAVQRQLSQPFGEWRLLTLMFYKLVLGLLAHARLPGRRSAADAALLPVIRGILHAAAIPDKDVANAPLAPYAAGIDRALGEAVEPAGPAWQLGALPACFDTSRLDSHAATLTQARQLLCGNPLSQPEWATWVDRIGELAQDTASLITDPYLASSVSMRAMVFHHLQMNQDNKCRPREAGRLLTIAPDDDFRTFVLRPRMARLGGFHGWMSDEGLRTAEEAWLMAEPIFAALANASVDYPKPCRVLPRASCVPTNAIVRASSAKPRLLASTPTGR